MSDYSGEVELYFHTRIHQHLFLIRLLDFADENGDPKLTGRPGSCLQVLKSACSTASFEQANSAKPLTTAVDELETWLNYNTPIKLWLPTLDIQADINVSRMNLLYISGNYVKHNLSRLTGVSYQIHRILRNTGYTVPAEHIPLALEDFEVHLQESYFVYYGTWLAELTNNVRWGIQDYLLPQFQRSYKKDDPGDLRYYYEYPPTIHNSVSKQWYERLLNNIRAGPCLPRFKGAHCLKKASYLERRDCP